MSSMADAGPRHPATSRLLRKILYGACLLVILLCLCYNAPLAVPVDGEPGWNDTNFETAFDPANQRGRDPGNRLPPATQVQTSLKDTPPPPGGAAGSGNFQLTVPVVRLPGRGLDLALDLTCNSRLWHKAGTTLIYNIDGDWPAPGCALGFGKLVRVNTLMKAMLVDADGTRHPAAPSKPKESYADGFKYFGCGSS
jgi:hypothetical protein